MTTRRTAHSPLEYADATTATAGLLAARDAALLILGARYDATTAVLRADLRAQAAARDCGVLEVAIDAAAAAERDGKASVAACILAAACDECVQGPR